MMKRKRQFLNYMVIVLATLFTGSLFLLIQFNGVQIQQTVSLKEEARLKQQTASTLEHLYAELEADPNRVNSLGLCSNEGTHNYEEKTGMFSFSACVTELESVDENLDTNGDGVLDSTFYKKTFHIQGESKTKKGYQKFDIKVLERYEKNNGKYVVNVLEYKKD